METDPLAVEIGARIRAQRVEREMTGKALADELEIPATQVTAWERGRVAPSARSILLVARALGCDPASLLPGEVPDASAISMRVARLPAAALPDLARFVALLETAYSPR
jgi:transcriptional regulator with XRE-family HTH domain